MKALFFQTEAMKQALRLWPEIVFIDGTYQLTSLNFTLILIVVEDSDGQTRIAGACLLESENAGGLEWCFNALKKKNEIPCASILNIMTDKDHTLRRVLSKVFPKARLKLCLFHTLQTFGRQVTTAKMNISVKTRDMCLDLLSRLAHSKSQRQYDKNYSKLCEKAPASVLDYYNTNWHNIQDDWVIGLMQIKNFLNHTNNKLEGLNSKVKGVVDLNSSLVMFFERFFQFLTSQHLQRNANTANNFTKIPSSAAQLDEDEKKFASVLTEKAMTKVEEEMKSSDYITFYSKNPEEMECTTEQNGATITSTIAKCNCSYYTGYDLPCKHIFATRKIYNLPLFCSSLYDVRWTKQYALQGMVDLNNQNQNSFPTESVENVAEFTPSHVENNMRARVNNLVHMGARSTALNFQQKVTTLESLIKMWNEGLEVRVTTQSDRVIVPAKRAMPKVETTRRFQILNKLKDIILLPENTTINHLAQLEAIERTWKANKHVELDGTDFQRIDDAQKSTITINDVVIPEKIITQGKPKRANDTYIRKRKATSNIESNAKKRKLAS